MGLEQYSLVMQQRPALKASFIFEPGQFFSDVGRYACVLPRHAARSAGQKFLPGRLIVLAQRLVENGHPAFDGLKAAEASGLASPGNVLVVHPHSQEYSASFYSSGIVHCLSVQGLFRQMGVAIDPAAEPQQYFNGLGQLGFGAVEGALGRKFPHERHRVDRGVKPG